MRTNFRQGLVAFQHEGATPRFLQQAVGATNYVAHSVSQTSTIVSFAHGTSDYLVSFDTSVDMAWGPMIPAVDNYLYWDLDLLDASITRGITTLIPIISTVAPTTPAHDQHWYDQLANKMKVWDVGLGRWRERVRVFAGTVVLGNTSQIISRTEGSQVGITGPNDPGYIVLDTLLRPVRKSNGEFLTDSDHTHIKTTVGTGGVLVQPLNRVMVARAAEAIPRMTLVYFSADDTIRPASSNPSFTGTRLPIGICLDALGAGEIGTVVDSGDVTYDGWDWSGHAGAALYTDDFGALTLTRPPGLLAYRVGFVKNHNTIVFRIDAETLPNVNVISQSGFIVSTTFPLTHTDITDPINGRVISLASTNATATASGWMTGPQVVMLGQHETRITSAEAGIVTLQNTKVDKITGAVNSNFFMVGGAGGTLVDSGVNAGTFALRIHPHDPADVKGGTIGQIITSDGVNGTWADFSIGSIDNHTDVDTVLTPPTAGQALVWNAVSGKWVPGTVNTVTNTTSTTNLIDQTLISVDL